MSIDDALSRISQIQSMVAQLQAGPTAASSTGTTASSAAAATPATSGANATTATNFASALAQAQGTYSTVAASPAVPVSVTNSQLSSTQQQFASRLASDTGLDPNVVTAWMLSEENGGAAQSRQAQNNNDWLNIGYTDAGTYGSADSVWSNPLTAADATAGWLKGQNTIPGYGHASAGIQAIVGTVSQGPAAQIAAIQGSGWASSGYPDLPAVYQRVAG
jgi:hypothetical protein